MAEALLKDQLRPASFRNVPFEVRETGLQAGRRIQLHEYPQRDKPYSQDMGRASRSISFQAFVVGKDYIQRANDLLTALETPGSADLVHPWFGKITVTVLEVASVRFDGGLGLAEFDLSFVEAGELAYPKASQSTQAITQTAAQTLQSKVSAFFSAAFKVAGYVNSVAVQALRIYNVARSIITNPLNFALQALGFGTLGGNLLSLYGIITNPSGFGSGVASTLSLAGASVAFPRNDAWLGQGIVGIVDAASHPALADPFGHTSITYPAASNPVIPPGTHASAGTLNLLYLGQVNAYEQASDWSLSPFAALPFPAYTETNPALTPSQQQSAQNTAVAFTHTRITLLVQAVGLSSLMPCAVYEDAMRIRDLLCAALDREAQALGLMSDILTLGNWAALALGLSQPASLAQTLDDLHLAIQDARAAVWNDLTTRARDSAHLTTIRLPETAPALAVAYDLYEDATRGDEIAERNKIARPGFLPITPLKVLSR